MLRKKGKGRGEGKRGRVNDKERREMFRGERERGDDRR